MGKSIPPGFKTPVYWLYDQGDVASEYKSDVVPLDPFLFLSGVL